MTSPPSRQYGRPSLPLGKKGQDASILVSLDTLKLRLHGPTARTARRTCLAPSLVGSDTRPLLSTWTVQGMYTHLRPREQRWRACRYSSIALVLNTVFQKTRIWTRHLSQILSLLVSWPPFAAPGQSRTSTRRSRPRLLKAQTCSAAHSRRATQHVFDRDGISV